MERREALEAAVKALEDHYREYGKRTMQYTEGYMDAIAVVRAELERNQMPRCCRTCNASYNTIQ